MVRSVRLREYFVELENIIMYHLTPITSHSPGCAILRRYLRWGFVYLSGLSQNTRQLYNWLDLQLLWGAVKWQNNTQSARLMMTNFQWGQVRFEPPSFAESGLLTVGVWTELRFTIKMCNQLCNFRPNYQLPPQYVGLQNIRRIRTSQNGGHSNRDKPDQASEL